MKIRAADRHILGNSSFRNFTSKALKKKEIMKEMNYGRKAYEIKR
jgi:hypothetical protein